jgi:hypothetical protein
MYSTRMRTRARAAMNKWIKEDIGYDYCLNDFTSAAEIVPLLEAALSGDGRCLKLFLGKPSLRVKR